MPIRLGPLELIIVLVIVIIIFGVGRLPEIGGAVGKAIREFRESSAPSEKEASQPSTPSDESTSNT